MTMRQHTVCLALLGLAALSFASGAQAAITVLDYYRLGEADPGAVAGNVANATTADSGGANPLARTDSNTTLRYSSAVSPVAAQRVGSTLATTFDGGDDKFSIGTPISILTNNFGIEAWVNAATTAGTGVIAYNGSTSTSGWGLFRSGGTYMGLYGGVNFVSGAPVTTGTWVHLALVRDNGVTTLYANGVASGTSGAVPNTPALGFAIGNPIPGGEGFNGLIDEVRVFSFAPGAFSTRDLLVNAPEPSRALLAAAGLGAFLLRRRRGTAA